MIITILMILGGVVFYIVKGKKEDDFDFWMLGAIFLFFWISLSLIPIWIMGFHYETGKGEHFGYITAVQKQGVFFKTGRAYVKTDNQSSQEDSYCVIDDKVFQELQNFAQSKDRVSVKYFSWFSSGIKNCGGEGDIIYEVEKVKLQE